MASDAFFPFADSVEIAFNAGIRGGEEAMAFMRRNTSMAVKIEGKFGTDRALGISDGRHSRSDHQRSVVSPNKLKTTI